jgi:tetratricopeptide (TPR) repeat protein
MKKRLILLVLIIQLPVSYGWAEYRKSDAIHDLSNSVDSLMNHDSVDSLRIAQLLNRVKRINWNNYFEEYKDQGPVRKLLDYCQKKNLAYGEIECSNGLGLMFRQLGKPLDAERKHKAALLLATSSGDTVNMMISLNNLGVNSRRIDDLKAATDYHMEVINLAEHFSIQSNTVKKSRCIALNSLGNIHISLKQYAKAIEIFKQSNAIERTMNSDIGQAVNLANIGEAFELSGRIDSARHYYTESLIFNEKVGSVLGIALCNNNLGKTYLDEKEYSKALTYFEKAIELTRTTGDKYHLIISIQNAARVWIEQKQYQPAAEPLNESIQLAKEINARIFLKEGYMLLSRIMQETGKYRESLDFINLSHQYSDSIFNDENQRHLNEIQAKYETEKQKQQIELLNKEHELNTQHLRFQRVLLWGLGIFSVLVAVVLVLLNSQQKINNRTREIELNQKLLRSQMNPHFIFNALGAIQNFMLKNEGRKAAFYLSSFSSLMRSILKNSREEQITLQEEKETLENYLNLHQLRLGNRLSFAVIVSDELLNEEISIPPMLIQPFVENAVLHGIENTEENGRIEVHFEKENGYLKIAVDDNGKGIDAAKTDKNHVSYAIQIFEERVENLRKTFGTEISYRIENKRTLAKISSGTLVTVMLKL